MINKSNKNNKFNLLYIIMFIFFTVFAISPFLAIIATILMFVISIKNKKFLSLLIPINQEVLASIILKNNKNLIKNKGKIFTKNIIVSNIEVDDNTDLEIPENIIKTNIINLPTFSLKLDKKKKYLHIALNNTIEEAREIISQLPFSDRILIEVGTPLLKIYGVDAIRQIKNMTPLGTYIVADNKCADLANREVEMMAEAGANAATCLGVAPIETIDLFIKECQKYNIDSIIDMMNVDNALIILKKLKKLPDIVMLHRGVDESEFSKEKQIPYYQIKQIKGNYNILVAVAGGDTIKEVQRAIFNDTDIVVVWKNFYQINSETAQLAESFLKEI